jgi:hypothetical protein
MHVASVSTPAKEGIVFGRFMVLLNCEAGPLQSARQQSLCLSFIAVGKARLAVMCDSKLLA